MSYYGYQPEQTKAQIRSTRGETIDLALPVTCLVGELRMFLIDEYGYDPSTRLLYNGLVADDNSYVCDYPFGSLMIATPADLAPQRQALPPRQPASGHQRSAAPPPPPPTAQEALRPTVNPAPISPSPNAADAARKNRAAEQSAPSATTTSARAAPRNVSPPEPAQETVKARRGSNTAVKHRPKNSPRQVRSTSTESGSSQGRAVKANSAAPAAAAPAPAAAASNATTANGSSAPAAAPSPATPAPPAAPQNSAAASNSGRAPASTAPAPAAPAPPTAAPPSPFSQRGAAAAAAAAEAPVGDAGEGGSEDNHRLRVRVNVECHIPSLQQVVPVHMNGESSVSDLILAVAAAVPALPPDAQVVYRGKLLPKSPNAKLFDLGIRSDARVFIAAGEYSNAERITLLEIEEDAAVIERAMKTQLTDLQRKGYYEELMRILFRTDGLQSLEGEWRQRRKDAVKRITALQDALGVEGRAA